MYLIGEEETRSRDSQNEATCKSETYEAPPLNPHVCHLEDVTEVFLTMECGDEVSISYFGAGRM